MHDLTNTYGFKAELIVNSLIEGELLRYNDEGFLLPFAPKLAVNDSRLMLSLMSGNLDNFHTDLLGFGSALARYGGETSLKGFSEIRSIVYEAISKIQQVALNNPGKIPFFANFNFSAYCKKRFFRQKGTHR